MAVEYIGDRYVPKFADPIEWDNTRAYEALMIVTNQGNSYTSKQSVPVGLDITDDAYWAETGNYNAQVEQYRGEVRQFDARITSNSDEISSLITSNADNISSLNKKIPNRVNLLSLGADNTGIDDCSDIFIQAINNANESNSDIYVPYGKYLITKNLPQLNSGLFIIGESLSRYSNGSVIVDNRPDNSGYLIDFKVVTTGGGVINLTFDGNNHNNGVINCTTHSFGWDGIFKNIAIKNYTSTVLSLDINDCNWTDILISNCSGLDSNNSPLYAIVFKGTCNRNIFTRLHIEHCRFMLLAVETPFLNNIVDSKFEMSASNMTNNASSPIYINTSTGNTPITFNNCDFINIDIRSYVDAAALQDYNVPQYILVNDSTVIQITNSRFMQGSGSSGGATPYMGQVRWIRALYGVIADNVFYNPSYMVPSIETGDCIFSNNRISTTNLNYSQYDTTKQINNIVHIGNSDSNNLYTGSIPNNYYMNNNSYGRVNTLNMHRNQIISASGLISWRYININNAAHLFSEFKLNIRYADTLGVLGTLGVRVVYDNYSNYKNIKLTNISLYALSASYKTINAYLLENGEVIVQIPGGNNVSIELENHDLIQGTSFIDTTITAAPTDNILASTVLTLE